MFIGKQFVRKYPLSAADWAHPIPIGDKAIQEYRDDANRRGVDLLRVSGEGEKCGAIKGGDLRKRYPAAPKNIDRIAPCYYLPDGRGGVEAFGHGQDFRIPYRRSIGDVVRAARKGDAVDFADAMFGLMRAGGKAFWSSRVFFEDARPEGEVSYEEAKRAHPLASPNPTSYQLYLEQKDPDNLRHWDSQGARIRGYKLYWHNAEPGAWRASQKEIDAIDKDKKGKWKDADKQLTREIRPLQKGNFFHARIRFSRLRPEELGALLMVFRMEGAKNIAYKLGKGKSIGLGSVRAAKISLFLCDAEQYGSLFAPEGGWNEPCVKADESIYLDAFKKHVAGGADGENHETAWRHVMGELASMLEWKDGWDNGAVSGGWKNEIREMRTQYEKKKNSNYANEWDSTFNQGFLRRDVLPTVAEVIRCAKDKP